MSRNLKQASLFEDMKQHLKERGGGLDSLSQLDIVFLSVDDPTVHRLQTDSVIKIPIAGSFLKKILAASRETLTLQIDKLIGDYMEHER